MTDTIKLDTCPTCGGTIPSEAPQGLCPKCVLVGAAAAAEGEMSSLVTSEIPSLEYVAAAFPQLEILELIGHGGMGFVFKARQPHLDRFVALKLLPERLAKDPRFAERFNREGRVLARLNHPNIVAVYDFGRTEQFYFLIMEYIDGVNLRQAMRAGRFSPAEALGIVPKICEALQFAHREGILHRDIKPANILLDTRGQVKLADFGIAKLVGEEQPDVTLTGTGAALGTLHYMAPEQLERPSEVDHRADIYSLGVVFYEMLTGELPIGRFSPPSSKTPVSSHVDEVVFRTLERDRELRFQSADEMKTQVEHLTGAGAAGSSGSNRLFDAGRNWTWSRKAAWAAGLVALSLPLPLLLGAVAMVRVRESGYSEWLIAAANVFGPGLVGTILGWQSLAEIRGTYGRLRGLSFAVFAALGWPVVLVMGSAGRVLTSFLFSPSTMESSGRTLIATLLLGVAAIVIFTTVSWSIDATTRFARRQNPLWRRSSLKWAIPASVLAGVLVAFGAIAVQRVAAFRVIPTRAAAPFGTEGFEAELAESLVELTFTDVELREEAGARWLTMNFVQQKRGHCEMGFPWEAKVPGWNCEVRTTATLVTSRAGFPPVLHHGAAWKLPDSLELDDARAFRDAVAKRWIGKQLVIEAGQQDTLFLLTLPENGGTLKAGVSARVVDQTE